MSAPVVKRGRGQGRLLRGRAARPRTRRSAARAALAVRGAYSPYRVRWRAGHVLPTCGRPCRGRPLHVHHVYCRRRDARLALAQARLGAPARFRLWRGDYWDRLHLPLDPARKVLPPAGRREPVPRRVHRPLHQGSPLPRPPQRVGPVTCCGRCSRRLRRVGPQAASPGGRRSTQASGPAPAGGPSTGRSPVDRASHRRSTAGSVFPRVASGSRTGCGGPGTAAAGRARHSLYSPRRRQPATAPSPPSGRSARPSPPVTSWCTTGPRAANAGTGRSLQGRGRGPGAIVRVDSTASARRNLRQTWSSPKLDSAGARHRRGEAAT